MEKYNGIVFSGGGKNGYAYLGVIKYLNEINFNYKKIKYYFGTSIGSVFSTLLALNINYNNIFEQLLNFDYNNHSNVDFLNIYNNCGLDNMEGLEKFLISLFEKNNYHKNFSFIELYNKTKNILIINALSLYKNDIVYFNYINYPNMPIIKALLASMSIPLLFCPIIYESDMFVDAGLFENFIVDYNVKDVKEEEGEEGEEGEEDEEEVDEKKYLGFNIKYCFNCTPASITNIQIYVYQLLKTLYIKNIKDYSNVNNIDIINIPIYDLTSINFILNEYTKMKIVNSGYEITKEQLKELK